MYEINNENGTRTLVVDDRIKSVWGVDCMICGKFMPYDMRPRICSECKQAVLWAKKKMKEEHNEQI